ncbi:MAG: 4Fe-4S binding protein [Coriobacteriia bacterium]|nr:4Fe-4S binding protein [Coriobacteriia bacterium]
MRDFLTGRWFIKSAFLVFFIASCVQLFMFAAWARGEGPFVPRPEAPAGLLPVGHFTSFFAWVRGGGWDTLLPAGLVIIIAALTVSVLFRRGFCGWICPVGTVWEACAALGRRVLGRNFVPPKWMDLAGRGVRFALTAIVVFMLMSVSLGEAVAFRSLPYMWVADLKILGLMGEPIFLIVALLAGVVSALIGPVWCRYLCPVGGLYAAVAVASPCSVTRDADTCIACGKCSAACHAYCHPDRVRSVRDTECDGCMDCVKVCPVEGCLEAKVLGRTRIAPWVWPLLVVGLWLAIFGAAKVTGNWDATVPVDQFQAAIQSGILERASVPAQR